MYMLQERGTSCISFIILERAYSVLGYQNFIQKVTYLLRHIANFAGITTFLQGWQNAGFTIGAMDLTDHSTTQSQVPTKRSLLGERRVGDNKTWIVPLNTSDITPSP